MPADGALPLSDQLGRAVGAEPNAGLIVMAALRTIHGVDIISGIAACASEVQTR